MDSRVNTTQVSQTTQQTPTTTAAPEHANNNGHSYHPLTEQEQKTQIETNINSAESNALETPQETKSTLSSLVGRFLPKKNEKIFVAPRDLPKIDGSKEIMVDAREHYTNFCSHLKQAFPYSKKETNVKYEERGDAGGNASAVINVKIDGKNVSIDDIVKLAKKEDVRQETIDGKQVLDEKRGTSLKALSNLNTNNLHQKTGVMEKITTQMQPLAKALGYGGGLTIKKSAIRDNVDKKIGLLTNAVFGSNNVKVETGKTAIGRTTLSIHVTDHEGPLELSNCAISQTKKYRT
jgi:hypothetical protein